jgi:hypothetical protein
MPSLATGVIGFLPLYHLWAGFFVRFTSVYGLGERLGWLWDGGVHCGFRAPPKLAADGLALVQTMDIVLTD